MIEEEVRGVLYYPSVGNKGYPYTGWKQQQKEYVWNTLEQIGLYYHQICRALRNVYKWNPIEIDKLSLDRILRIYDETVEDHREKKIEEDFD